MGIGLQVRALVSDDHTSKDFDIIHLVKNNKDNLLNRTKFLLPHYHFDYFTELLIYQQAMYLGECFIYDIWVEWKTPRKPSQS